MSTVYARRVLGHLTQEGIVIYEPKFKLVTEAVTEHFPEHVKKKVKNASLVRHQVKLEEPESTPTAGQRVRQYIDGVLIGVGHPEEIRAELERRKRCEKDLGDSRLGNDITVKTDLKTIRAINVENNPQVKRKLMLTDDEVGVTRGNAVVPEDVSLRPTGEGGDLRRRENAEELRRIQQEHDDRVFEERLSKELLEKQKVLDNEMAAKKMAQEQLDIELLARKDKLDRQERDIE